jgi:hypothetical protein
VSPRANLDLGEQKINVFLAGNVIMVAMKVEVNSISMKVTSCIPNLGNHCPRRSP